MAIQLHFPAFSFLDANGVPLSGGELYFYEFDTTTPLDTYSDEDLTSAHPNPIPIGSDGRAPEAAGSTIWLKGQDYKVIVKDSAGVTIRTVSKVQGNPTVSGDDFKVSPQNPADMTVSVSAGTLFDMTTKARVSKAAQTSGAMTAPVTNPRIDVIYVDKLSGVIGITTGSEAASPSVPTIPDGKLPLAQIALAIATTEIGDNLITDIRELANIGTGSAAAVNTGATATDISLNAQDYVTIASATAPAIFAAASDHINITGTTTIAGFDTATAGLVRYLKFAGILTITHHATSNILPGGADITTAAGDQAKVISEGSGNTRWEWFTKADGVPVAGGKVLQVVQAQDGAVATGTTTMPLDDTIPQITEGDEYMTLAITPKSASSYLLIEAKFNGTHTVTGVSIALFQDATADALAATHMSFHSAAVLTGRTLRHVVASASTTARTFRVRVGSATAGTTTFNGVAGARIFGGVMDSGIIITEYIA